jgi:hypothetical protein
MFKLIKIVLFYAVWSVALSDVWNAAAHPLIRALSVHSDAL